MIYVSSICCFVRFQYDLKYASSEKPSFPRHVPFQIHDTRKQWQWSVFRQSVVLSGFNMTWNTDNDLPFVKKLQISCRFTNTISPFSKIFSIPKWCTQSTTIRMLLPTARKCIPLLRNTDNDLPFVKKLQISCSFTNSICCWKFFQIQTFKSKQYD